MTQGITPAGNRSRIATILAFVAAGVAGQMSFVWLIDRPKFDAVWFEQVEKFLVPTSAYWWTLSASLTAALALGCVLARLIDPERPRGIRGLRYGEKIRHIVVGAN